MTTTQIPSLTEAELPVLDMDDPDFWQDVHTPVNRAREASPFARTTDGAVYVLRFDDVEAMLKDPRFLAADLLAMMGMDSGPVWEWWQRLMFSSDGLAHSRLRKLVSRAFTPRRIEELRPRIRAIAERLFAPSFESGHMEPMREIAHQLPSEVMSEMLGIPEGDREDFREWTTDIGLAFGAALDPDVRVQVEQALEDLERFVSDLIERRRTSPGDDLLSALLAVEADGDRLTERELIDLVENLMFAGHDTTRGALGAALALLAQHPDQAAMVAEDRSRVPALVEEIFRFEAITFSTARTASDSLELAGFQVDAGATVGACLPAASRDPRHYDRPDEFDITRTDVRPPTFGYGAHYCLGAALARAEMQEAMDLLFERCTAVHLDEEPVQWTPFAHIRRIERLPVTLELR